MKNAYLLVASGDAWEVPIGVFFSPDEAAKQSVAAYDSFFSYSELCKKGNDYLIQWRAKNPPPPIGNYFEPSDAYKQWHQHRRDDEAIYRKSIGLRALDYESSSEMAFGLTDSQMCDFCEIKVKAIPIEPKWTF